MNNISDQAFATLYSHLEDAFESALVLADYRKALEIASIMKTLEQAGVVPSVQDEDDTSGDYVNQPTDRQGT